MTTGWRILSGAVLGIACLAGGAGAARAATTTTTFTVSANVVATCLVTAGNLDFGTYSPASGSPNDATSTVNVTCVNGQTYAIALDAGVGASASLAARKMTVSGNTLTYALYTSSGYSTVWGDGTASSATVSGSGNGSAQAYTVYGRIPAGQYVSAGAYTDTITVTVTY